MKSWFTSRKQTLLDLAEYYFLPVEVWARAYEQFIAQNCRDVEVRREFHEKRYNRVEIGAG